MTCIFGSAHQWASIQAIAPDRFNRIAQYEQAFNCTIQRTESITNQAQRGTPYPETQDAERVAIALSDTYDQPIVLQSWQLPAGAYGEQSGPS